MRKVLLFLLFITINSHVFAYITQSYWRWRNNDGTEKTATWKAALDSSIKISDNKAIRLRAEIYNSQTNNIAMDRSLQYATSVNGPWSAISNNSAINAFNLEGNNGYITNNDSTTQQIADPTYVFQPGNIVTTNDPYTDTIYTKTRREYEWCIKPTSLIQPNTTYYFKSSAGADQALLPSLTTTGTAFVAGPQPILINGGFENNLTSWTTVTTNSSSATFNITTAALQVHTGTKALKVTVANIGTASNSATLSTGPVTLSDTGTYMLRFWALASQRNALLDVNLKGATTSNTCHYQIYNRFDTTANGWQMYQYAFRVSQSPVTLQLIFNTATTYYLDDVEIINSTTNPNIDIVNQYDWQNNFAESYGWLSGDNDNPVLLPDKRVAWVFNDTFMGKNNPHSNVLGIVSIIHNLLVIQKGDTLTSRYGGSSGSAQALFSPTNTSNSFWNAGGLVENNVLKVLLIEQSNNTYTGNTWIGTLSLPNLAVTGMVKLPATITSYPNCVFQDGKYDYLYFGVSNAQYEVHTVVGRVPTGWLDSQTAWQFYVGDTTWSTDFTKAKNLIEGVDPGNVITLGPNNYAMSGVFNLSNELDVWFAQSPAGPWVNKTPIYEIPAEEHILPYEGHLNPLGKNGVYTLSYSVFPFVTEANGSSGSVAMQIADKTTYVPCYAKANLLKLSPFSGYAPADSLTSFSFYSQGKQVTVQFQTAQLKHDHIIIQQSTDNTNWTTVATVAGTDTTFKGNAYQAKFNNPLNGQNYYHFELFDEDNKMTVSPGKSLLIKENAALTSFTAQPGLHNVNLAFSTSSELFNDHFTIETSPDSLSWSTLTTILGAGTLAQPSQYQYTDNTVSGIIYYRLHYYSAGALVYSTVQKADTRPSMTISSGSGQIQGNTIAMQINSSSETNNPGFIIQSSPDGVTWQTLIEIQGSGTTNAFHSYHYTDNALFNDPNFFRIGYYYKGVQTLSPVKSVNITLTDNAVALNVYPNPGHANISFDLKGYAGQTFTATLTSLYGKQLGKKTITVNSAEHYTLESNAAPGTYILNISGNKLAKSSRVLVQ